MGFYEHQVLPRFIDVMLGKGMEDVRARVAAGLCGDVLELGFGSGRNLPHTPASVTRLLAVEPAAASRTLAAQRVAEAPFPVDWIGLDGQDLPLKSESVDHVLVTWTLCTIPDVEPHAAREPPRTATRRDAALRRTRALTPGAGGEVAGPTDAPVGKGLRRLPPQPIHRQADRRVRAHCFDDGDLQHGWSGALRLRLRREGSEGRVSARWWRLGGQPGSCPTRSGMMARMADAAPT